jgi:hypothetical protein
MFPDVHDAVFGSEVTARKEWLMLYWWLDVQLQKGAEEYQADLER